MNQKHILLFDWNQEVLLLFCHMLIVPIQRLKKELEILTACDVDYSIKYHFYSEAHTYPSFCGK